MMQYLKTIRTYPMFFVCLFAVHKGFLVEKLEQMVKCFTRSAGQIFGSKCQSFNSKFRKQKEEVSAAINVQQTQKRSRLHRHGLIFTCMWNEGVSLVKITCR